MALTLGTIGTPLNIKFRQGSSFGPYPFVITNKETGLPVNLTGYTIIAKVKKSYTTPVLASMVINITEPLNGKFEMSLPSSVTATIKGNPEGNPEYIWDMEYTSPSGITEPLFYGTGACFSDV